MDDYAYINARVKAMQGRLFTRARYESLLAQNTMTGLLEALRESPYARALEWAIQIPTQGFSLNEIARIDESLRLDLTWCLGKLKEIATERPRTLMEAILLRWDSYNLKTVLRGKRASATVEEILASAFPVGALDEPALAELARAPTLRAVADTLATWRMPLARPVREGLALLETLDTLQPLEVNLDRFTYTQGFKVVANGDDNDRAVRDYLGFLVDKTNLLTALRYLEERSTLSQIEASRHFLEGEGRFTRAQYQAVVGARDLRHGLSLLASTSYKWLAESFAEGKAVSLPLIERKLDRAVIHAAVVLSRRDPLGIGVVVGYIERKIDEVRNIRMITRGKALGMGAEQLAEWLIV